MSSDNSNNPTYFVAEGLVPMMPSQAPNLRYPSSRPFPILDQENHENPSQEDEDDEEEEEENDEEEDEDEDIKQDPATTWRNFLKPGQRHTIDWYDFAHTERFHSREYDPHQGVSLAERWRESRTSPSLQGNSPGQGPISTDQALNPSSQGPDLSGQEPSGQGSSDGIDDNSEPNYMTTLRSAEQNREVPTGVTTLTSLLNPIPQNALESFHRKQLESWNADLLSYKEAFCKLMDRSRSLKSQYDCWVLLEERLCSAVDCYQRLIHQNNELDNVLQTLREIGQSMRYMFALLSNTDATLREGLLGESSEEMEARLSGSNNEAMCQIISAQLEIARCSDEEKQKVQSLRNGLGLLDTIGGISGTFSEYNLSHPDRGPFTGYDLFSVLKAKGRANQLSDLFHRPKLDVLEADAQGKRRKVKINEVRLDLALYLFNLAMDIATPCNGAQVRCLNSIESPIALRMFNTPSVCQLEKLEVDFKRMDWPKQDWRMYPSRNVMSEPLISAMNAHQNASTNINMETVVDRCLEVGNRILARNWHSLEELIWRGPCCYKCYNGIKHNCDFRKPYRLDVDKIFEEIMAQVHVGQGSQQQQQYFSGSSDIYANQEFLNVYPPFFGQSRLVVLSLNHWLFTRDCLTRILEFSPHLLSLSLTQCTMKGNAKSEESIFGGYPKGRGCGQGNTPVFQHRGLRVLAISISTLFTQERHSAFYGILDGQHPDDAIETDRLLSDDNDSENDSLSSYLISDDEEEEEEESMENEALGHFSPPSSPKRRSGNSPRKVTPWQVEAIDSLESSLFEHFPNLEHWKLVPGMQNSLQVTWIGREVQRYCPNLNKLTVASDAFVDSESTALLVRSFRPMPPHQLSTGVNSAIYNIPLEEENDSDNISLLRGYRLANGKGLKVFRAEEELYGRALVKALLLHSSTLEVLDLDASNEYWNIWPGEIDGDHVRAPRRYDLDERAREDTIQSHTRPLQDNNVMPPLPSPPLHASQVALVNGQGIGLGYGNQITPGTLTATGTAHSYPNSAPHTPLPMTQSPSIQSSTAHHPTTLPPLSPPPDSEPSVFSDDDDEDAYQGPWVLRRPYSFLDTLLQQSTRLRQIKLPRNEVDIMQTLLTPNWQCASTLEELWISVHGLYNADDIAQIMRDMRAVEVTVFERLRDRYDNLEGVVPLSTKDTNNNDEDEDEDDLDSDMPKEPKGKDTSAPFTSHKQFQEYMDENLRYEDDNVDSEDIARQRDAVPASTNATLPIPGTLRYQVIQLLRQFTSLRYLWIGEGLYMLPPRVSNEPQNDTTIEPDSTGMLSKIPFSILQNGDEMALIAETDQFDTDFKIPLLGYPNMNYQGGGGAGLTYVSGSLPSEIGFIAAGHFDTATQQQKYFERMALKRGQSEIVQEVSDISPQYKKQHTI